MTEKHIGDVILTAGNKLSYALDDLANAASELCSVMEIGLSSLGLRNASTGMGALELLSLEIKEGSQAIASGLHEIADALREKS